MEERLTAGADGLGAGDSDVVHGEMGAEGIEVVGSECEVLADIIGHSLGLDQMDLATSPGVEPAPREREVGAREGPQPEDAGVESVGPIDVGHVDRHVMDVGDERCVSHGATVLLMAVLLMAVMVDVSCSGPGGPRVSAMAGVHDLGGRDGFGPVPVDDDVIFHDDWERRAFALTQLSQGLAGFNTDAFRHGIEREAPEVYESVSYFDKWIRNGERMLVEGGVVGADAVSSRLVGGPSTAEAQRTTDARPPEGRGAERQLDDPPRFASGDRVIAQRPVDPPSTGHTRLPDYVLGRVGTVALVNGAWIYPDSHAHGRGERPTWVYAVRFSAADLWPDDGLSHAVHVDLFEPYLEPA